MHKGRNFRRVLPPACSPNYQFGSHAPVYLLMDFTVTRGLFFQRGHVISEIATPTHSLGQIDWKFKYNDGFQEFGAVVSVRLIPHSPDHALQAFFVDSDANHSVMTWRVGPGEGRWSPFGDNYGAPGLESGWTPPWGPIQSINLKAVGYHDEPPPP